MNSVQLSIEIAPNFRKVSRKNIKVVALTWPKNTPRKELFNVGEDYTPDWLEVELPVQTLVKPNTNFESAPGLPCEVWTRSPLKGIPPLKNPYVIGKSLVPQL